MEVAEEILEVAKQYLGRVSRSGPENVMAACPFHRSADGSVERRPSFALSLTKGVYFCHSCHAKGTLRTLLRELGLSLSEIEVKYGLLIKEADCNRTPAHNPTQPGRIWVAPEHSIEEGLLGLFEHDVSHLMPKFQPGTLKHFDVGWDGWHHRITYPIRDLAGKLVAVSGRTVVPEVWPRYKVYNDEYRMWGLPTRPNWEKKDVLWNAHDVYDGLLFRHPLGSHIVVVEGFKAAMWVWESGIRDVVALLGSYLSWEQKWILERMGATVYLFLDNDKAGQSGSLDAAGRLSQEGLSVRMVQYPQRLCGTEAQPDDLTHEEIQQQWSQAPTFERWLLDRGEICHSEKTIVT